MRKKILITLFLILLCGVLWPRNANSVLTPSRIRNEEETRKEAPNTPSPIRERIEEEIKERTKSGEEEELPPKIKEIRETVREKVQQGIREFKKEIARAYVGKITQIEESSFNLETRQQTIRVNVTPETKIIGKKREKLEFNDLKIGDFCIAMGFLEDPQILEAKRIVIISPLKPRLRQVVFGKITDISSEEKVLTVENERKKLIYTVTVTNETIITKKINQKVQKIEFNALEKGDRIVAIGNLEENGQRLLTAKIIHVIYGLTKEKKVSSPSPSPTPLSE